MKPGIERVNYSASGSRSEPAAAAAPCSRMRRSEVADFFSFFRCGPKFFVMSFFENVFVFVCLFLLVIYFFIGYPFFYRRESGLHLALSVSVSARYFSALGRLNLSCLVDFHVDVAILQPYAIVKLFVSYFYLFLFNG